VTPPEATRYLEKARQCLSNARATLNIGLSNDAGRNAYLAAFHTAQAFIFVSTGKVAKTHSGVRSEFSRLAKDEPRLDKGFSSFLARAYTLKEVADYEMGPDSDIPIERSAEAIESAVYFLDCVAGLLGEGRNLQELAAPTFSQDEPHQCQVDAANSAPKPTI
jgi:uncharacterized protein (UPF0332 family)